MKKYLSVILLVLACVLVLTSCASKPAEPAATTAPTEAPAAKLIVAVPNDATNEGRALLLLQSMGIITLKADAGITATAASIESNPKGIEIREVAAQMLPNIRADVDYAIINNNFAIDAGIIGEALHFEDAESPYVNVVCVNSGNENTPKALALAAALKSQAVVDFINTTFANAADTSKGFAIAVVAEPTDGYDATVDYEALKGEEITIACSPAPHHQILEVAAKILAEKGITLKIIDFDDYVQPNMVVHSGEVFANYFAHIPYQNDFNEQNGTNLVVIAGIHVEPMGLYGGKQTTLEALQAK